MMQELVDTVNRLQDVFSTGISSGIDLPQIVVVGSQSAGKSSVLERILGKSFLPKGTGIVTRCPLVLQLVHTSDNTEEYAVFEHDNTKHFTDYELIKNEIEEQTEKLAGKSKHICRTSINLKICSPSLLDLTLVDLPGLMKVPVGDQPADIEKQTRNLILEFIENPNSIILAVTPANADMATSDSLKIAKQVDPEGKRTLAVLTKLDLMDKGTDAWHMLLDKVVPVIGVVNRSQKDIIENKTMNESQKKEAQYLNKNYKWIAALHGSPYLAKRLKSILINHIQECIPDLKKKIIEKLKIKEKELSYYPKTNASLLQYILFKFNEIYRTSIIGCSPNIQATGLSGGARIHSIFKEAFSQDLNNINPLQGLDNTNVISAIESANGMNPAIFVPEAAFVLLAKHQVEQFRNPSLKCVELVHKEMLDIALSCLDDKSLQLEHFPKLEYALTEVISNLLQDQLPTLYETVELFMNIETTQINTEHPDFLPKNALSSHITYMDRSSCSDKKDVDYQLMVELIESYMEIEKKKVEDTIPKMIRYSLVEFVLDHLYKELVEKIFVKGNYKDLLCESPETAIKRSEIKAEIAKLKKAKVIIKSISKKSKLKIFEN